MSKPDLALWATEGTGRAYRHPFRLGKDGKPLTSPSITTCLKHENKDNLIQWSANQTLDWAVANWHLLGTRSTEDALKAGRYRWKDVRDLRAEVGTGVHETIEAEHAGTWNFPELDAEQLEIMEQWALFNEEYEVEPILSEFTVWNFTEDYAGTGDGWWKITNRLTGETFYALIDLKTSRGVYGGQWAQIAALKEAEVLMVKTEGAKPDSKGMWPEGSWTEVDTPWSNVDDDVKFAVVHLRAPEYNEFGQVTREGKHDLIFGDDLDLRFEQFKAYRTLWGVEQGLKDREKERATEGFGAFE